MSKTKLTLLSIIMKENRSGIKSQNLTAKQPQICSLADKDVMIQVAAGEILRAAKVIKRAVIKWYFRKLAKSRIYITDIYFEADHDIAENVYIVGEFTSPKWTVQIPMKYSFFYRAFTTKIKIRDHCQFKFVVDGTFICCPKYSISYTYEKFTNNVFKVHKSKFHMESKSFSEFNNLNFGF